MSSHSSAAFDLASLVSVVVPARDAAATIEETLDSLRSQTYGAWEAVVVDDGSADHTRALVGAYDDERIRLVPQGGGGVGATRMIGARASRGGMLLFLDADDWLLPTALERLAAPLLSDPALGGTYCGWRRVAVDGDTISEWLPANEPDLFLAFARFCPFAVHSCLLRRTVFDNLGGFDLGLRTCEDWDLWQRLTRTGIRLEPIDEILAVYRTRPGSISLSDGGYIADGLRVVRRGHTADPRIPNPIPEHRNGAPASLERDASCQLVLWGAGLAIGGGREIGSAFDLVAEHLDPTFPPGLAADTLYWAVPVGAAKAHTSWPELLHAFEESLSRALCDLEERTNAPRLAVRARRLLERRIAYAADGDCLVGATERLGIDVTLPLGDVVSSCERLVVSANANGAVLGVLELPILDGRVPARILADALAEAFGWTLVGHVLGRQLAVGEEHRWHAFLREFWGRPDWPLERFYKPVAPFTATATRAHDLVELTALPERLVSGGSATVSLTLAGSYLGDLRLPRGDGFSADELIALVTTQVGYDLCTAAAREAIIGRRLDDPTPLRQRLERAALPDEGGAAERVLVVLRREPALFGTAASRLAALPSGVANDVRGAARRLEECVVGPRRRAVDRILYRPDLPTPRNGSLRAAMPEAEVGGHATVPILMYHRVTDDAGGLPTRFRVTPAMLESQLRHLRREGYRSITWIDWLRASASRKPLQGHCVILTFDDGYLDFATHAWPLLRRHGFGATLFVVTDAVGKWNGWDHAFGPPLRLLDWKQLRRLHAEGAVIGAHSATHPPLTGLSYEEVVREGTRARAALYRRLGAAPQAFAYPYGDTDPTVARLIGASGYVFGLTCRQKRADFDEGLLDLPRIEVDGDQGLDWFDETIRTGVA